MENTHSNPERLIAIISILLSFIFVVAIPASVILDSSGGFDFGFGFAFASLFLLIFSTISAIIFWIRANDLDNLFNQKNLLAHYIYTPQEWSEYIKFDHKYDADEKKLMLFLLAGFSIFFSVVFLLIDFEPGLFVLGVLLAINLLIFFLVLVVQPMLKKREINVANPQAFISKDAAYIGKSLHTWKLPLTRFNGAELIKNKHGNFIKLTYSTCNPKSGPQYMSFHILVPNDKLSGVNSVIDSLNAN
ncbi:MAG: hypothetical protein WC492_01405 [Candidatus Micrarchaeia archaeon]